MLNIQGVNAALTINFGRFVNVSRFVITLRGDFPHDGGFTDAKVVFSDGTQQTITLRTVKEKQEFVLNAPVETETFVLQVKGEDGKWSSISEVEVYGTDVDQSATLIGDVDLDGDVDSADLTLLAKHVARLALLTNSRSLAAADVNTDGTISASDLTRLARLVGGIDR